MAIIQTDEDAVNAFEKMRPPRMAGNGAAHRVDDSNRIVLRAAGRLVLSNFACPHSADDLGHLRSRSAKNVLAVAAPLRARSPARPVKFMMRPTAVTETGC